MLARSKLALASSLLLASALLSFSACSSSEPRDLNFGTDAGLGWIPPDASAADDVAQGTIDASLDSGGSGDVFMYDQTVDADDRMPDAEAVVDSPASADD
jgi:hypothetical protein